MKHRFEHAFILNAGILEPSETVNERNLDNTEHDPSTSDESFTFFKQDTLRGGSFIPEEPYRPSPVTGHGGMTERRIVFGLGETDDQRARELVSAALRAGYRHLDVSSAHGNEEGVGQAVKEAGDVLGLTRAEISVGAKLPGESLDYDAALREADRSLARLGLEWFDILVMRLPWSFPDDGLWLEAWSALMRLKEDGRADALGVANFMPSQVDLLISEFGERPAVNQLGLNPYHQCYDLCQAMNRRGVPVEAYSPFGGLSPADPLFRKMAVKHGRTPAQIVLRWHLESGRGVIPRSTEPLCMRENLQLFDFRLDAEEMRQIALLDRGNGFGLKESFQ